MPDIARLLLDDDQGICDEGHPCRLVQNLWLRRLLRACDVPHPDNEGRPYTGMPLIRWGVDEAEVSAAEAAGVDPNLIEWARSWLADRDWCLHCGTYTCEHMAAHNAAYGGAS
jgi:hypothetical protein